MYRIFIVSVYSKTKMKRIIKTNILHIYIFILIYFLYVEIKYIKILLNNIVFVYSIMRVIKSQPLDIPLVSLLAVLSPWNTRPDE